MVTRMKKYLWGRYVMVLLALLPTAAFADDGDALTSVLQKLVGLLTSTPARLLGIIAVIGVGYMTIHEGKIPKGRAISIVVGIGLIFGASWIAQQLGYGV